MRKKGCIGKSRDEIKEINNRLKELYPKFSNLHKPPTESDLNVVAEYNYYQGKRMGIETVIGYLNFKEVKNKNGVKINA